MNVPRLPNGVAASDGAESQYHTALNRYLILRERSEAAIASGSWTPVLTSDATAPTVVYNANRGRWTRVGPLVMVSGRMDVASVTGGTGNAGIGGLPFNCDNDAGAKGGLTLDYAQGFSSTTTPRSAILIVQTNRAMLWTPASADARDAQNVQVTVAQCVTPALFFHGLYFAS